MMQYNCGYSSAGHLVTVIPLGIENRFTNGKKKIVHVYLLKLLVFIERKLLQLLFYVMNNVKRNGISNKFSEHN